MVRLLTYLESLEPLGKNGGMVERNIWAARVLKRGSGYNGVLSISWVGEVLFDSAAPPEVSLRNRMVLFWFYTRLAVIVITFFPLLTPHLSIQLKAAKAPSFWLTMSLDRSRMLLRMLPLD